MNSYEQKQEARRERLLARAAKLRAAAQRPGESARQPAGGHDPVWASRS